MGAHAALPVRVPAASSLFLLLLLLLLSSFPSLSSSESTDVDALRKFRASLNNAVSLTSWDPAVNPKPPCSGNVSNWLGIFCFNGIVWGFRLENMALMGEIDVQSLAAMPHLRSISLMNNAFVGPIPNLKLLNNLKSIYLSYNHFSGDIPDDLFAGMNMLKKVYLGNNDFTGKIPSSLAALPNLLVLRLDNNKFRGTIPDFQTKKLKRIDLSNNELEGPIPSTLSSFNPNAFTENARLCGKPLRNECNTSTGNVGNTNNNDSGNKSNLFMILLIVALVLLVIVVVVASIVIARLRSAQKKQQPPDDASVSTFRSQASSKYLPAVYATTKSVGEYESKQAMAEHHNQGHSKKGEAGKLTFVRDGHKTFDLPDLLKASAEILGSASFGSSYKAVMKDDISMVVKRYKHMNNVNREEFSDYMTKLGQLSHPNILPLVAYYYRKEEKLLVSGFVQRGCLASHLHGNHNSEQGLDWPTRLKIVKGVARGLSYLYNALPNLVVPHGHLKSSNVLLDESFEPLLTDFGLISVINHDHAQQIMMPYKSPEYAQLGRITKKTDVWSFGIVILEILTGKFPENYLTLRHDPSSDIASWVNTMITEKRTGEVFDAEMGGVENSKGELLKLLKIGLSCCEENVERRLDIKEALQQIEELKDSESDANFSLLVTNERDAYKTM